MADVTSSVTVNITSVEIINSNGETVEVMKDSAISTDPADYSPKVIAQSTNHFIIHAEMEKTGGGTFADGDEIKIPTRTYAETGSRYNTVFSSNDWSDLAGTSGVIGQWRIVGESYSATKRIEIVLNSRAAGKAVLSSITMDLGTKGVSCYGIAREFVARFNVGTSSFAYGMTARQRVIYRDSAWQSTSANNNATGGIRTGVDLYNSLINSRGTTGTTRKALVEGLYEESTSIDIYRTTFANACPYSLTEQEGCFVTDYLTPNFTATWTELTPNSGESYSAFKTRIMGAPLRYGFYPTSEGTRLVYYLGEIGVDTPEWSDYRSDDLPSIVANAMIAEGWYDTTDETALTAIYRSAIETGIAGKHITANHFAFILYYDTVLEDTQYPYSVTVTYDPEDSSPTTKSFSGNIKLTGAFGTVVVKPFSCTVMKYDDETKTPLAGAKVKLQRNNNGTWTDYTAEYTTDSSGLINFENLGLGTYRVVETEAPDGYSLRHSPGYDADSGTVISETFTIASSDTEGAKIQMGNVQNIQEAKVTYYDITYGTILKEVTFTGTAGDPMEYDTASTIAEYVARGYEVVRNTYTKGTLFDDDSSVVQEFTVMLKVVDDMINVDCSACEDLREISPDFVTKGVTTTICTSLKNDTGLNPTLTTLHDDCEDLDTANDCLIGQMDNVVEEYEACDWQKFMHKFIPNLYQMLKAMICALCGLWTNIHNLWKKINNILDDLSDLEDRMDEMCALVDQAVSPVLTAYGTLPLASSSTRRCGTPGSVVIKMPDDGTLNPYTKSAQNIGIAYNSMTRQSCSSDSTEMLEWIAPSHYYYKLAAGAEQGDVLWRIKKTQAQSVIGISDYLWQRFVESSWTWHESALSPSKQSAWLVLSVGKYGDLADDEMGIVFWGCSAPDESITSDQQFGSFNNASARLYRHTL